MTENSHHLVTPKTYGIIFAILLVLMVATMAAARLNVGEPAGVIIALAIAVTKMSLIVLFFMHVLYSSKLTWVFMASGFFWFMIMVMITISDYLTRGWHSAFTE
jgi:cytochrome c oxidase subunit 4